MHTNALRRPAPDTVGASAPRSGLGTFGPSSSERDVPYSFYSVVRFRATSTLCRHFVKPYVRPSTVELKIGMPVTYSYPAFELSGGLTSQLFYYNEQPTNWQIVLGVKKPKKSTNQIWII